MFDSILGLFNKNDRKQESATSNSDKVLYVNAHRCPQNHRCPSLRVCPTGALTQDGYKLPNVDMEKCIKCGKCIKFCPMRAIEFR